MPKFLISETIHTEHVHTVRLGTVGAGNQYGYTENGKAVKLAAESAYVLAVAGDTIEGIVQSSNFPEQGTVDGFSIGGIFRRGYKSVVCDGLQGTPGVGVLAIGDYVVTGTVQAKGTDLPTHLKVTKATDQVAAKAAPFRARVVSLGQVGTGAVGTAAVIDLF